MPELPEVQTIVDDLNRKIKGDTIVDFWSDAPNSIKNATVQEFKKAVLGRKIIEAHRIGKNMFIALSGGKTMYIHLKMTGHLLVKSSKLIVKSEGKYFNDRVNQYIHHIWHLKSQSSKVKSQNCRSKVKSCYDKTLEFSDMRKFAKIVLLDTKDLKNYKDIKIVGIDVMSKDFTLSEFRDILSKRPKMPIGIILMDQGLMAGIGNIYRSEILFEAGILPTRLAKDLDDSEIKELYKQTRKVLRRAIKLRGTSDSDYRDTSGAPGGFQKVMKVYNREKKKCAKCDTIIIRKKMGGRSVFFCGKCQA